VRIHLAAEHAAELEHPDPRFELRDFPFDVADRGGVILGFGKLEQFGGVRQRGARGVELLEVGAQPRAFAPQFLRALGVVPDILLFQLADDFFQALFLGVVVKGTPEARRCAR
jgi:hypothetical protein